MTFRKSLIISLLVILIILLYSTNFRITYDAFTSPDENIIFSLYKNIILGEYSLGTNPDFTLRGTKFINERIVSGKFYGFSLFLSVFHNLSDYRVVYLLLTIGIFIGIMLLFKGLSSRLTIAYTTVFLLILSPLISASFNKGLMEQPLPIFLIIYGIVLIEKKRIFLGFLLFALSLFYRPDYIFFFITIGFYFIILLIINRKKILKDSFLLLLSLIGFIPLLLYNNVFYGSYFKIGPSVLYESTSKSTYIPISVSNNLIDERFLVDLLNSLPILVFTYLGVIFSIFFIFSSKQYILKKYIIIFFISGGLYLTYLILSGARFNEHPENSLYRYLTPFIVFFTGVFIIFINKHINKYILITIISILSINFLNITADTYKKNLDLRLYYNKMITSIKQDSTEKNKLIITDTLDKIYNIDFKVITVSAIGSNLQKNISDFYDKYHKDYDIYLSFGNKINIQEFDGKLFLTRIQSPSYIQIYRVYN